MAKSNIGGQFTWKRTDNVLIVYFVKTGEKRTDEQLAEATFNLQEIWSSYKEFDEVQAEASAYGIKQKLADSTALPETVLSKDERVEYMVNTFHRLSVDRLWNNKTKADPDKVKVSQRELGKIDSLADLRAMKMLDGKAGFIMPQEAKDKLVELEAVVVEEEMKDKKKK